MDVALLRAEWSRHLRRAGTVRFLVALTGVAGAVTAASALGSAPASRPALVEALDNVGLVAVVAAAVWGAGVIGAWFGHGVALALAVWRPRRATMVLTELVVVAGIAAGVAAAGFAVFSVGAVVWARRVGGPAGSDTGLDVLLGAAAPFVVGVAAAAVLGATLSFVCRSAAAAIGIIVALGFFGEALIAALVGVATASGGGTVLGWLPIQSVFQILAAGDTLVPPGGPPRGIAAVAWITLGVVGAFVAHQHRELR